MKHRVVVSGLGVATAISSQVDDLWKRILAGESGVHPILRFDVSDLKVKIGGEIYGWDPSDHIPPKEIKRIDRFTQFAMVAGIDAVRDAGIDFAQEDPFRCGVILGTGVGGLGEIETQMTRLMSRGPERVSPMTVPRMMLNAASGNLAIHFGVRGPNYAVATACASANNAIGDACRVIQYGEADVVITGGTEAAMTRMGMSAFQNIRALSLRNDEPERASRPFDLDRDGFVLSEGAGLLVLESLEHAQQRNARIYCEVLGHGVSNDAGHITQPDEQGVGAARAMANALESAHLNPEDIDYINAHGTSTPLGDQAETVAVKTVFQDWVRSISISSTKSHLGHLLGASGGVELVLTINAMRDGVVPATINLDTPDPNCDLDFTPNQPRERKIRRAMSNSFGFGGHNASIIVGPFE